MTAPTERKTWTRAPAGASMATVLVLTGSLLFSGTPAPAPSHSPQALSLRLMPQEIRMWGAGASQRLVVVATFADGNERDVTAGARLEVNDRDVADLSAEGKLVPRNDGDTAIRAEYQGQAFQASIQVRESRAPRPFSFSREIGGILTRRGCNDSACHGGVKGRGGFKLSLDARHPQEDHRWIVEGGTYQVLSPESAEPIRPRVDPKNPEESLLLQKPTFQIPHGGGSRFSAESADYAALRDWVREGAPVREAEQLRIERIEIFPSYLVLEKGQHRQLLVTGHLGNGRTEDLTDQVRYETVNPELVRISPTGRVEAVATGETALLVRAPGRVANSRIGVIADAVHVVPQVADKNLIDRHVFAKLRKLRIAPSSLSSDEEFLRRICLDLTGTLPPPERAREFLSSTDPAKRDHLIDTLLETPEYIDYWTFRFSDLFRVSYSSTGTPAHSLVYWAWIRNSLTENKPYHQMALERISAQGNDGPSRHFLQNGEASIPADAMPEEMRVFLGYRLDCAQCHHHPFEEWSQDQFWGLAAFFGRLSRTEWTSEGAIVVFEDPAGRVPDYEESEDTVKVLHPRTGEEASPVFPDGTPLSKEKTFDPRMALAEWIVAQPNFSRTIVNRMWGHMFGRGIVDPVDDFRSTNPPTHPELLDELARDFAENGYDLKRLLRLIAKSRTYQLSAVPNATNRNDMANYSHRVRRDLDAEILLDAISDVTGVPETFKNNWMGTAPRGTRAIHLRVPDLYSSTFLDIYDRPNRASIPERKNDASLKKALHIMVGSTYQEKIGDPGNRLHRLLKDGKSDGEIIEELYLRALSRFPTDSERSRLEQVVSIDDSREETLKDIMWAMITSREFASN